MKKILIFLVALFPIISHAQLGNLLGELKKLSPSPPASISPATPPLTPTSPSASGPTAPSRTDVSPSRNTESAQVQNPAAPLNLKGFHLKMSKDDVKKIIPTIESYEYPVVVVGGRKVANLQCGELFSKLKRDCSFTYAGKDIVGIIANFWGDELLTLRLIYNAGPDKYQVSRNEFKVGATLKEALVTKFGPTNDRTGGANSYSGRWLFGSQRMSLEGEDDQTYGLFGAITIADSILVDKFIDLRAKKNEEEAKKSESEKKKKTLSDM